jgi:outer membrane protein OmpA-like peptidoglycan-associated protein
MAIKLVGVWLATFCLSAQACSGPQNLPGENIDIEFAKNSSNVTGENLLKLANWTVDMKLKYSARDDLHIGGFAEISEASPLELAGHRAEGVKMTLVRFGFVDVPTHVSARIYKPLVPNTIDQSGRRVEVQLLPGCADDCCDGL